MERLTERNRSGIAQLRDIPEANLQTALELLCKYEETGLTPEEIEILESEIRKLIDINLRQAQDLANFENALSAFDRGTKPSREVINMLINSEEEIVKWMDRCAWHCNKVQAQHMEIEAMKTELEAANKRVAEAEAKLREYADQIQDGPYYYNIGEPILFFWEDEWRKGKIINGYRTRDGIISVELENGKRLYCGEAKHREFVKPNREPKGEVDKANDDMGYMAQAGNVCTACAFACRAYKVHCGKFEWRGLEGEQ